MIFEPKMRIQIEQHTGDLVQGVITKIEGQWATVRWDTEQFDEHEDLIALPEKICHVDYLTKRLR